MFASGTVKNVQGKIQVEWIFDDIGGLELLSVMVTCHNVEERNRDRIEQDVCIGAVSAVLPNGSEYVQAGIQYTCEIIAINELGRANLTTNTLTITSGAKNLITKSKADKINRCYDDILSVYMKLTNTYTSIPMVY